MATTNDTIGALGINANDHLVIDDTTPVVIDANPSRFVLGIVNKSASDNLIVTIIDKGGVNSASFLLLPGHLYEPQVMYGNEIQLIAELNDVSAAVWEG